MSSGGKRSSAGELSALVVIGFRREMWKVGCKLREAGELLNLKRPNESWFQLA